jgi:hypothetical protein
MDRRSAPTVVVVAFILACGPERGDEVPEDAAERYADALCAAYEECGCGDMAMWSHPDGNACREETLATFGRVQSWNGTFSLECFDRLLEWIPTAGCTTDGWDFYHGFPDCLAFTGTLGRGEQCSPEWDDGFGQLLGQPCAGTSSCVGYCVGPNQPARVGEGEACNDRDVRCMTSSTPGGHVDLYCSPDRVCLRQAALGETCTTARACANDLDAYCDGLTTAGSHGICRIRKPPGSACDPDAAVDECAFGSAGFCSRDGVCMTEMPKVCEAVTGNLQVFENLAFVPEE